MKSETDRTKERWKRISKEVKNIYRKKIVPQWLNFLRENENIRFAEFEAFCIHFDSEKFFYDDIKKGILDIFGSFKNLNYKMFWDDFSVHTYLDTEMKDL